MMSMNLLSFDNPCFERRNWEEATCSFRENKSQAFQAREELKLSEFNNSERQRNENIIENHRGNIKTFTNNLDIYESNIKGYKNNISIFEDKIKDLQEVLASYEIEDTSTPTKTESFYADMKKRFSRWWNNDFRDSFENARIKLNKYLEENDLDTVKKINLPKYNDGEKERKSKKELAIKNLKLEIKSHEKNIERINSDILIAKDNIVREKELIKKWKQEIIDLSDKTMTPEEINQKFAKYEEDGVSILNEISDDISDFTNNKNLNDCQKACLLKCTTSEYLTHEYYAGDDMVAFSYGGDDGVSTGIQEHGSFGLMLKERVGVCFDFSVLYQKLADKNGVNSKSIDSIRFKGKDGLETGHAFNTVEIDGKLYKSEPQSSRCEFYY